MCKSCSSLIGFISTIVAFIYLIKVYGDTKIDVFQQPIHPGEKEKYFIDPASNPDQLLKYDRQCQVYQDVIMNPNTKKLGDVFTLNTESIHNQSFYIIFLDVFLLLFYVFFFIAIIFYIVVPQSATCLGVTLVIFGFINLIIMFITNILFFILLYNYYSGDTNAYNSFLECKNINYIGFSRYRIVEALKNDFFYFMIFSIISLITSFIANRNKEDNNQSRNRS